LIANHALEKRWEEVFLLTAEMLADADELFALWLDTLDDMARQSARLTRLLKLVETQAPYLELDEEEGGKELRAAYASYMPLQLRVVTMHRRTEAAVGRVVKELRATYASYTPLQRRAVTMQLRTETAHAAACVVAAAATLAAADKEFMVMIRHIQDYQKNKKVWRAVSQQLLTIFRAYFPAVEYELTEDEANQVTPYLESTALLLRCLKNACVSNRGVIENLLLRKPMITNGRWLMKIKKLFQ